MNRTVAFVWVAGLIWQSFAIAASPEVYLEINENVLMCEGSFLNWKIESSNLQTTLAHRYVSRAFLFQSECESFKDSLILGYQPGAYFPYTVIHNQRWRCIPRTADCGLRDSEHLAIHIFGTSLTHSVETWAGSEIQMESNHTPVKFGPLHQNLWAKFGSGKSPRL
jgi:hypothetical protein